MDDDLTYPCAAWQWERGVYRSRDSGYDQYGRLTDRWHVIDTADRRSVRRGDRELRPYSAVDALGDVLRCAACRDRAPERCSIHGGIINLSVSAASTDSVVTLSATTVATADSARGPQSASEDQPRPRRPLSSAERSRRRKRRQTAKRSRRANRS